MKPKRPFWISVFVFCLTVPFASAAENDSSKWNSKQKWTIAGLSGAYLGGFTGLYHLWYADYNTGKFHFFNDNPEWAQMDKVGHMYSAYAETKYAGKLLEWSGFEATEAVWLGSAYSLLFQTTIEVFDGFSEGWGASTGDIAANFAGTGLYLGQEMLWKEQRIAMKFSFRTTPYAAMRPELLGYNAMESMVKDYNGQKYWLSANLASFLKEDSRMPKWLNVSVGYGIDGFISGRPGDLPDNFPNNPENFPRMRLFYLSPDIDLEKIEVKNRALKATLSILNNFKFPLPAVGFSQSGQFEFLLFGF